MKAPCIHFRAWTSFGVVADGNLSMPTSVIRLFHTRIKMKPIAIVLDLTWVSNLIVGRFDIDLHVHAKNEERNHVPIGVDVNTLESPLLPTALITTFGGGLAVYYHIAVTGI